MNKYTMAEIAFVDRCLFPDDLVEDLINVGLNDALSYKGFFRKLSKEKRLSVVVLYQEYIPTKNQPNSEFVDALEKVMNNYLDIDH